MDKRASLLMIAFLCGLLLGVFGGLAPELFSQREHNLSACHTPPCFLYSEFKQIFPVLLICGAALAFATLLLAKGLHRLFFGENNLP